MRKVINRMLNAALNPVESLIKPEPSGIVCPQNSLWESSTAFQIVHSREGNTFYGRGIKPEQPAKAQLR